MDEYVTKEAAINAAIEAVDSWDGGHNKERERRIIEAISNLPLENIQPIKIGEWIDFRAPCRIRCSICGQLNLLAPDFCPSCGAYMINGRGPLLRERNNTNGQ